MIGKNSRYISDITITVAAVAAIYVFQRMVMAHMNKTDNSVLTICSRLLTFLYQIVKYYLKTSV